MAKYRWRTKLRSTLPAWCMRLLPKGRRDCGDHDWYKSTGNLYRCYHCQPGAKGY